MLELAQAFPWIVGLTSVALAVVVIRLDRRVSRGSQSAGPRQVERPKPAGLQQTSWELKAIDDQVRAGPGARARADLVHTINRLTAAAGFDDPRYVLPPHAPNQSVQWVVNELESRLELGPLLGRFAPEQGPGTDDVGAHPGDRAETGTRSHPRPG